MGSNTKPEIESDIKVSIYNEKGREKKPDLEKGLHKYHQRQFAKAN